MWKIYHIGRDTQTFQGVTHSLLGVKHMLWGSLLLYWGHLTPLGSPISYQGVFHTLWGSPILYNRPFWDCSEVFGPLEHHFGPFGCVLGLFQAVSGCLVVFQAVYRCFGTFSTGSLYDCFEHFGAIFSLN
jgi:hypothetical protein